MLKIMLPGAKEWLYVQDMEHVTYAADFAKAYGYEVTKENTQIVSKNPEINELIEKYQQQTIDFKEFMFQLFRIDGHLDLGWDIKKDIKELERTCREPEQEDTGW